MAHTADLKTQRGAYHFLNSEQTEKAPKAFTS
ncbi:hypothetical protein BH160DRAFT_6288 [Burkholderia sp. H160]|nr:hypothetical protein BH160DRAFT_6288 [Burkholderia sp. H160]